MTALRIRRNFQLRAILYASRGQLIFDSDDCLCKLAPRKSRAPMSILQVYSHHISSFVLFPKAIISLSSVLCSIIPLHFSITDNRIQHNQFYVLSIFLHSKRIQTPDIHPGPILTSILQNTKRKPVEARVSPAICGSRTARRTAQIRSGNSPYTA